MERAPVCAYCRRRPVAPDHRPFCSERCRLLDLGGWLNGSYRIAGESLPSERDPQTSEPDPSAGPEPPSDDA